MVSKQAKGTYRAGRDPNFNLPQKRPTKPRHIQGDRKKLWEATCTMLEKAGIISEIDGLAIEMFVDSIAVYREANQAVLKDGFTVMGGRGATKANPAISARDTAWTQLHRLLREFGLTPKSRGQKPNTDLADDDNGVLKLLSPGA